MGPRHDCQGADGDDDDGGDVTMLTLPLLPPLLLLMPLLRMLLMLIMTTLMPMQHVGSVAQFACHPSSLSAKFLATQSCCKSVGAGCAAVASAVNCRTP